MPKCLGVPDTIFDFIKFEKPINIQIICKRCKITQANLLQDGLTSFQLIQKFNAKLSDFEFKATDFMQNISEEIEKQIKERFQKNNIKETIQEIKNDIIDKMDHTDREVITLEDLQLSYSSNPRQNCTQKTVNHGSKAKENLDRNKRKANIIIFNMPEATERGLHAAKESDMLLVQRIFHEILGKEALLIETKYMTRLGKKSRKCRPLLVSFRNTSMKWKVIKNAKLLAQSENTILNRINIVQDKTPMERAAYRVLKHEFREIHGEENVCKSKFPRFQRMRNGLQGGSILPWPDLV